MNSRRNTSSSPRGGRRSGGRRRSASRALILGWAFLGVMVALAVAAIAMLLGNRPAAGNDGAPGPAPAPGVGSAFRTEQTAPPLTLAEGTGGRAVEVKGIRCDFTEPGELIVGTLKSVDLSAIGNAVADNARSSGWGEVVWTVAEDGSLLLRAREQTALTADAFDRQEAFLASAQPENLARTFLENSGIIDLLRPYGLELSRQAENNDGMILFRGTGDGPETECSVRFSFLYTGAFNQAVIRAVYLDSPLTTAQVTPLKKAAENAVTWSSADAGGVYVTACEIRPIRGIPFYVMTCQDGTVAYALAVDEGVLAQVPGAADLYREMMAEGLQEYVAVPGAAY